MKNIQSIMFGELRPWLESNVQVEEYYRPQTRSINAIQPAFNSCYELNFIRHISDKTQYYKKLIDNDINSYCNEFFKVMQVASTNRIAFKLNKTNKELHTLIREVGNIICTQKLDLVLINSVHSDFTKDKIFKDSTFIIYYLLTALIKCSLDIQNHFLEEIREDDIMEVADFYTRILQQQAPSNSFIKKLTTLVIEEQPIIEQQNEEIQVDFATQILNTRYQDFMEAVTLYQFLELPKMKALNQKGQNEVINLIINREVPYGVALLFHLGYLDKLKKDYSLKKEQMYSHLKTALNSNSRTIKGNCLVLQNPDSNEDRFKYPAETFIAETHTDYNAIIGKYPK